MFYWPQEWKSPPEIKKTKGGIIQESQEYKDIFKLYTMTYVHNIQKGLNGSVIQDYVCYRLYPPKPQFHSYKIESICD